MLRRLALRSCCAARLGARPSPCSGWSRASSSRSPQCKCRVARCATASLRPPLDLHATWPGTPLEGAVGPSLNPTTAPGIARECRPSGEIRPAQGGDAPGDAHQGRWLPPLRCQGRAREGRVRCATASSALYTATTTTATATTAASTTTAPTAATAATATTAATAHRRHHQRHQRHHYRCGLVLPPGAAARPRRR